MRIPGPLLPGRLVQRYKRFLADIRLESGATVTVHCPNPGSMKGLLDPGSRVLISESSKPARKLRYTWELIQCGRSWVGINTFLPNRIVREAIIRQQIARLAKYDEVRSEIKWRRNCRFDFRLRDEGELCFVEVKNVTLARGRVARFPDARTERGIKHLRHLTDVAVAGHRAVIFFLVNRGDCNRFEPAADIDPDYSRALHQAANSGVEVLVYRAKIRPPYITVDRQIPHSFGNRS